MQPEEVPGSHVLGDIYRMLVAMSTKLDVAISRVDHHDRVDADHETRLRSLERGRWPLPSIAVLLALASAATAVVALLAR